VQTYARNPVTIVGVIKSTEHRNTETRPKEVEEEPMTMMRAQEKQRRVSQAQQLSRAD
jgi:hypothetical protein